MPDAPQDAWLIEKRALERERDELSRRLDDALGRLAGASAGAYSGETSGHTQLAQDLRTLKLQDFQGVCVHLYDFWKGSKNAAERQQMPRAVALTHFRKLLADRILVQGVSLLLVRACADPVQQQKRAAAAIRESLHQTMNIQKAAHLPEGLLPGLDHAIERGLDFITRMLHAAPPGCLFLPPEGVPFTPAEMEAVAGCSTEGAVRLTVFPGYVAFGSPQVLEKALVYTVGG